MSLFVRDLNRVIHMTLADLIAELDRFQAIGGTVRATPTENPTSVIEVQDALRLQFPPEFVEFYQTYQSIRVGRNEFVAINYLAERYQDQLASKILPSPHLFPVLDDPTGGGYYLVCGHRQHRQDSERGRILHYPSLARPDEVDESHRSFFDFIISLVRRAEDFLDD